MPGVPRHVVDYLPAWWPPTAAGSIPPEGLTVLGPGHVLPVARPYMRTCRSGPDSGYEGAGAGAHVLVK
jgi:hypothetical protein